VTFVSKRRIVVLALILVAAIVIGIVFGFLAGIAVVVGVASVVLFGLGTATGGMLPYKIGQNYGRERFGSEDDRSDR
jgi:hypothetical protein